jgi:hypothetical protein
MLDQHLRDDRRRQRAARTDDPTASGSGGMGRLLRDTPDGEWLVVLDDGDDTVGPLPLMPHPVEAPTVGDRAFVHVDHAGDPAYAAHLP